MIGNTVSYRDERTIGIPEKLYEVVPKYEVFKSTGTQLLPIYSLFQLYSMRLKNSPVLEVAERFLMLPDIFNYYLTGVRISRCQMVLVNLQDAYIRGLRFDSGITLRSLRVSLGIR